MSQHNKTLTAFKLAMMAVVAIDSLKNLPSNAQYGPSLVFYYCLAMGVFFMPSALVSAEMATSFPHTGGAYIWIREAFGKGTAFIATWMQWLLNVTWAPTILIFLVITASYYYSPTYFESHKLQLLLCVLSIFWGSIFLIASGIKTSSYISVFSAIIGVILPMGIFIALGVFWILAGKSELPNLHVSFDVSNPFSNADHLRLLLPLLLSLMGMEMIGVHAEDVHHPQKNYPKALLIASLIIFFTVIPASVAIMLVLPTEKIQLTTGIVESFEIFLNQLHLLSLFPIIIFMIIIGSFGIFYNWLLTISRYLLSATQDGALPISLAIQNKKGMPIALLILQGIAFSILTTFLILMPSIEQAFWLMTAACTQFGLIYYILLFSSAIKLRLSYPNLERPFQFGKKPFLLISICCLSILVCFSGILFGFIPPSDMTVKESVFYKECLLITMISGIGSGLLIFYLQSNKSTQKTMASEL